MKDLIIYGTGGFAREVHQIVEDLNLEKSRWNFLGFLDDNQSNHGKTIHDFPVLGGLDWLAKNPAVNVSIGVGQTAAKRAICKRIRAQGANPFATLIHPRAWIGNRVVIGEGTIICAGTLITTDIQIREHVILNLGCTVGHDTSIEPYVTVAPSANISGAVHIGEGSDLGTNCTIIQGLSIGEWTIVGAGAVVVRDLPANVTAVGNPAKVIKERPAGWFES